VAVPILGTFQQDIDDVAGLDRDLSSLVEELADGDQAFRLVADVHDHGGFGQPEDGPLDHLAFRHVLEAVVVERDERSHLLLVHIVALHGLESWPSRFARACASWSGLCAQHVGRHNPVLCVRHSLKVLLCSDCRFLLRAPATRAIRARGVGAQAFADQSVSPRTAAFACR